MYGGGRSGKAGSGVYARRRILAVVIVLLLLALLVPRACQALMGESSDTGSKGKQQANAAGKDADTGSDTGTEDAGSSDARAANTNAEKTEGSSEDDSRAPFLDNKGNDEASGSGEEAAPDLLALVPTPIISSAGGESASPPSPSETGDETQAAQQPATEPQNFVIARHEAAKQPPSGEEPAPAPRSKRRPAPAAVEPAAAPRAGKALKRRDLIPATPVVDEVAVPRTIAEPAPASTVATLPAAAATPVPAPALQNNASFVPSPAGGALRRARAIGPAPAALRAGPRLGALGPAAKPGRAVF